MWSTLSRHAAPPFPAGLCQTEPYPLKGGGGLPA